LLGFIMLYTFRYTFVADHYQYVACLGPIALAAAGLSAVSSRSGSSSRFLKPVIGGGLLVVLGMLTWRQCGMYTDLETLWRTTLARNPKSYMARNNLGTVYLNQGRLEKAMACFQEAQEIQPHDANACLNLGAALFQGGQADGAIRQYQKALEIQPDLAEAHKNLGDVFLQLGRVDEALAHSRKAVEIRPGFAEAQNNLGNALLQKGQVDEAIAHLQKAVDLLPEYPNALNNLGVALVHKGKAAAAMALFQKAVDLQPDFAEAHNNLGKLQLQKGNVREAVAHYQTALKLQPDDPDTLSNLAWVLATWPEASVRNGSRAMELAQRANELSGDQSPVVLGTLAAACAEAGQFAEAMATARLALQLAESQSNPELAGSLRSQITLYQAGTPFRDTRPAGSTPVPANHDE
jgi:tetratricopeptide (TPR) repeat protein